MRQNIAAILLLFFALNQNGLSQKIWTKSDQTEYVKNHADSTQWDWEMLQQDLEGEANHQWPTQPALSNYPSPVSEYDWGYCFLGKIEIKIADLIIEGNAIGYAKDDYRAHLLSDSTDYYINYFNIFILTDLLEDEAGANTVVSRNYPHYLSSGKQKTSQGSVDWVQMNWASGENFAIINQRYFDLSYGRTLLVMPLQDGSLRFLQMDDDMGSITRDQFLAKRTGNETNPYYDYLDRLSENKKVKTFFSNQKILK